MDHDKTVNGTVTCEYSTFCLLKTTIVAKCDDKLIVETDESVCKM